MKYVGIYTQQASNNAKSIMLLMLFPLIILGLIFVFCLILGYMYAHKDDGYTDYSLMGANTTELFVRIAPIAVIVVGIWFVIAYFFNTSMIRFATGARPLERKDNMRVYNIVENLTMTCGMPMPKINVIDSPELNAFASGIDDKSYTVTVTTGICDRLNDAELAGVIGHELTHIRNRDTRLLVVSIIFVGIMSTIMQVSLRILWYMGISGGNRRSSRGSKDSGGAAIIVILAIAAILAAIGYLFTLLTRFAISRKREFMADAGGAELCGDPLALASALRKISGNPYSTPSEREDVHQLFIVRPQALNGSSLSKWFNNLFSTHPDIEKRIEILEQF